ncbi:MAG: WD40/YVTN/BNR-like repeat-containing protein [Actinomycetota bacterium]
MLVSHTSVLGPQFVTPELGFAGQIEKLGHPAILRTADGGRSWDVLARPCPFGTESLSGLSFATPSSGLAVCTLMAGAGNQTKAVLRTEDGGRSWRVVAGEFDQRSGFIGPIGGLTASGYAVGVSEIPDGTGWLPEWLDGLFATSNEGGSWHPVASPVEDALGEWLFPDHSGLLYGTTPKGHAIFRTRDAGATWRLVHVFDP